MWLRHLCFVIPSITFPSWYSRTFFSGNDNLCVPTQFAAASFLQIAVLIRNAMSGGYSINAFYPNTSKPQKTFPRKSVGMFAMQTPIFRKKTK